MAQNFESKLADLSAKVNQAKNPSQIELALSLIDSDNVLVVRDGKFLQIDKAEFYVQTTGDVFDTQAEGNNFFSSTPPPADVFFTVDGDGIYKYDLIAGSSSRVSGLLLSEDDATDTIDGNQGDKVAKATEVFAIDSATESTIINNLNNQLVFKQFVNANATLTIATNEVITATADCMINGVTIKKGERWYYNGSRLLNVLSENINEKISFCSVPQRRFASDIVNMNNFNTCVKALWLKDKPTEPERYIITNLSQVGSAANLKVRKYNYDTQAFSDYIDNVMINFDTLNEISIAGEVACKIYISLADYIGAVSDAGQGNARMPFITDFCFKNEYEQGQILKKYTQEQDEILSESIEDLRSAVYFMPAEVQNVNDTQDKNDLNSAVKALYIPLDTPLTANERIIVKFFNRIGTSNSFQFAFGKYNTSTTTYTEIASDAVTYTFDTISVLYSDMTKTEIVGYIYASLDDYIGGVGNIGQGNARFPYLNPLCFEFTNQPLINNYFINENVDFLLFNYIELWGNSITYGAGATPGNTWADLLTTKVNALDNNNLKVVNCGVGGESATMIAARQGGIGMYSVNDITLPALAADTVEVATIDNFLSSNSWKPTTLDYRGFINPLLIQGEGRGSEIEPFIKTVNPVQIDGIKCKLTYSGSPDYSEGSWTLQRLEDAAEARVIKAGTFLHTNAASVLGNAGVFVGFLGTNGGFELKDGSGDIDPLLSAKNLANIYKKMIVKGNYKEFVIITPYGGTAYDSLGVAGLIVLENTLIEEFGSRVINLRKYFVENGLSDAGITPTQADLDAIALGEFPPSLWATPTDDVHPNPAGHTIIFNLVNRTLTALGCFNEKIK